MGPAGPELLTVAGREALERLPVRFVRTVRHPSAVVATDLGASSFDSVYDEAERLEDVYASIVDTLCETALASASTTGEVVYAVPGSPVVAERTVELLLADGRVDVRIVPGLSFLDLAWARLGVDPLAAGVRLVDGHRFGVEAAGERGPLLVAQCDSRSVLSDVKLAVEGDPPPKEVVVLRHLGLPDESVSTVEWADLDRSFEPDHLTSLWIPELAAPVAGEVARFAELVRVLRARCPWDREQTHRTLTRHLIEETYEVLEAIEADDLEHLEEELGDLLFQVVFHATLGAEEGAFTLADVARGVHDKLVGRHPHVFGDVVAEDAGQVMRNWEHIKQAEKGASSLMDGIPGALPSLLYAHKVQRKAASVGVEVEPAQSADLGERLFALVAEARRAGTDPETALHATAVGFRDRFVALETLAVAQGVDLRTAPAEVVGALWREAGAAQSGSGSSSSPR